MYNRYINAEDFIPRPTPTQDEPPNSTADAESRRNTQPAGGLSGLRALLGDRFKLPDLSQENLLLLAMVYLLVTDEGDKPGDILLLIAALFLLGL